MTLENIRNVEFNRGRGYRADEVDDFIDACADTVQQLIQEKEELNQKMKLLADKLVEYRNDEDSIRAALLNAQRTGDTVLREAEQKAQQIIDGAKAEAEQARQQVLARIEAEKAELEQVQREVAAFKARMLTLYKEHLELLQLLPEPAAAPEQPADTAPVEASEAVTEEAKTESEPETAAPVEAPATDDVVVAPPTEEVVSVADQEEPMKPVSRFSNLKFGNDYDIHADDEDEPTSRRKKRK